MLSSNTDDDITVDTSTFNVYISSNYNNISYKLNIKQ